MINLDLVLEIHEILIKEFGGDTGIKDMNLLKSALSRPFQTFDGNELYPTLEEKASALLESIIINHPFVDGNKRTGYFLARFYLLQNNMDIIADQVDKYNFIIDIASGKIKYDEILIWVKKHSELK